MENMNIPLNYAWMITDEAGVAGGDANAVAKRINNPTAIINKISCCASASPFISFPPSTFGNSSILMIKLPVMSHKALRLPPDTE
jgi:hypothetical protein